MAWEGSTGLAARVDLAAAGPFRQTVTYTPAIGGPVVIEAVFDQASERMDIVDGMPVISRHVTLGVHLADLAADPAEGDLVSVGGVVYTVAEPPIFDAVHVGAELLLHKVAT